MRYIIIFSLILFSCAKEPIQIRPKIYKYNPGIEVCWCDTSFGMIQFKPDSTTFYKH